jgi:hypothetical protein
MNCIREEPESATENNAPQEASQAVEAHVTREPSVDHRFDDGEIWQEEEWIIEDHNPCRENLSDNDLYQIQVATIDHTLSHLYRYEKSKRLTASNFGRILTAMHKRQFPVTLYKAVFGLYDLQTLEAVQFGMSKEMQLREVYTARTGRHLDRSGLRISRNKQFLACTPFGISGNILVEAKSSFKHRNTRTVREAALQDRLFCLDSQLKLKKWHWYYAQLQGAMYVTQLKRAQLMMMVGGDVEIIEVPFDPAWARINVPLLEKFYREKYLSEKPAFLGYSPQPPRPMSRRGLFD